MKIKKEDHKARRNKEVEAYKAGLERLVSKKLLSKKQVGDIMAGFEDGWLSAITYLKDLGLKFED